jgi:hypothetical protein
VREVNKNCERYRANFERLGESRIRKKLQDELLPFPGEGERACAEDWLAERERERSSWDRANSLAASESNRLARQANRLAIMANIIAATALIVAIVAIIASRAAR